MNTSRTPAQITAIAVGLAIVVAAISTAIYHIIYKGSVAVVQKTQEIIDKTAGDALKKAKETYAFAKQIVRDIDNEFHFRPKVTSAGTTVVEASQSIAELSTVEKPFEHTYSWEHTWLKSTKRIKLKGFFVAKAGYDLTKPFSIDVSEDRQTIRATMPPAKLNSVEQTKLEIIQEEGGFWNKISQEERQSAMNALLAEAKKSLDSTTLLADADTALMTQLESAVRKSAPPSTTIVRVPLP